MEKFIEYNTIHPIDIHETYVDQLEKIRQEKKRSRNKFLLCVINDETNLYSQYLLDEKPALLLFDFTDLDFDFDATNSAVHFPTKTVLNDPSIQFLVSILDRTLGGQIRTDKVVNLSGVRITSLATITIYNASYHYK